MDIKELLNKGVVEVIVKSELEAKLKSKKKLRVKLGIDPSGADLHLGHMVVIKKLAEFQEEGHTIQLVFGTFTGQIGDPSGKLDARQAKSKQELRANAEKYLSQVKKVIDIKKIEVSENDEWLGKMKFSDVVGLSQIFTVQQMLERDMYQKRLKSEKPIYMHEFLYPLMQGYDSVALKSDLELGGTDQTFNLLAGRTIQKAFNMEPQNILTVPLLVGTDGKEKMGKSMNNYIGVAETPQNMFGKTMSLPDELIVNYFELITDLTLGEIDKVKLALKEGENPRNLKIKLAKEIVKKYHSVKDADLAEKAFIDQFTNKEIPENIPEVTLDKKIGLLDLLLNEGQLNSKGEGRRLIEGGGIKINDEKVSDFMSEMELKKGEVKIIQIGKRKFLKVKAK